MPPSTFLGFREHHLDDSDSDERKSQGILSASGREDQVPEMDDEKADSLE
jgi:hypothetical protein